MLKSKIHRATITKADLNYEGSISVDNSLLERATILPYEKVDIYNITNGERFSTYVIPTKPDSGDIQINGAAAHKAKPGDMVIIVSYVTLNDAEVKGHRPKVIQVDSKNQALPESVVREI